MNNYGKDSIFDRKDQSPFVTVREMKRSGIKLLNEEDIPDIEEPGVVIKEGPNLGPDYKSTEYSIYKPNAKPGKSVVGTFRPEFDEGKYRGHVYHSGQ